mmetsp:Transcript_1951/g.2131  ORF Transcript_1951/g.2131 Transcript_1951/m.2131 type:complete len:292 (-) Transcript_1951:179-1054(-)
MTAAVASRSDRQRPGAAFRSLGSQILQQERRHSPLVHKSHAGMFASFGSCSDTPDASSAAQKLTDFLAASEAECSSLREVHTPPNSSLCAAVKYLDFDSDSDAGTESTDAPGDSSEELAFSGGRSSSIASSDYWTASSRQSRCSGYTSSQNSKFFVTAHKQISWFTDAIDIKGNGSVHFREFLSALRQHPELQAALAEAAGVHFDEDEQRVHSKLRLTGPLALSVDERTDVLLKERGRVKEIFAVMCEGLGDDLTLEGFLSFFDERGMTLLDGKLEKSSLTRQPHLTRRAA